MKFLRAGGWRKDRETAFFRIVGIAALVTICIFLGFGLNSEEHYTLIGKSAWIAMRNLI